MRELVVISGKGGTGKTSITAAFAELAENNVLCDADVDAADLHLLTAPEVLRKTDFQSGGVAAINPDLCTQCGLCQEKCRWDAISDTFEVNEIACEGCGVCVWMCPEGAIDFVDKICGQWFISDSKFGPMVHARLGIAEENSGKLVSLVRQQAKELAEEKGCDLIITDGPPGVGCPVIASIGGATALLIITEPTVSGLHDMERVAGLAAHFKIPTMVCVNKYDLNLSQTEAIRTRASRNGIMLLDSIPFDPAVTKAMVQGDTVLNYDPDAEVSVVIRKIWKAASAYLKQLESHQVDATRGGTETRSMTA